MKKVIFGVFPAELKQKIKAHENQGHIISDVALFDALSSMFKKSASKTGSSMLNLFEYVGLPTKTAQLYKRIKNSPATQLTEGKTLLAAVVPLELEEQFRLLFKKYRANNISTINCP